MIYFVTSNDGKFAEASAAIPGLVQMSAHIDEIQSLDPQEVLEHKLMQAANLQHGELLIDDTSLSFDCLGGALPGTMIKWFLASLGQEGLVDLARRYNNQAATARAMLGYRDGQGNSHYVTGEVRGTIVPPRGAAGFGWDAIFQPDGFAKTYAELGNTKLTMSHRFLALKQLQDLLDQQAR